VEIYAILKLVSEQRDYSGRQILTVMVAWKHTFTQLTALYGTPFLTGIIREWIINVLVASINYRVQRQTQQRYCQAV